MANKGLSNLFQRVKKRLTTRAYQPVRADRYVQTFPSLSAATLKRVIDNARAGWLEDLMDLLDDILLKDAHLYAVYQTRRMAVASKPWEIVAAGDDERSRAIADFVREAIDYADNFDELRYELTDAIGKGFAVAEIEWELKNNRLLPARFVMVPQRRFTLSDDAEELRFKTSPTDHRGEELENGKWIVHKHTRQGSILASGVLVPCLWYHLFKVWTLKDWAAFLELYGTPLRVGKYDPGATDDDIKVLTEAIINIAKSAGAVVSKATEIEFIEANKRALSDIYERFENYCNREMSKCVLGQTLTTEPSERGTQALGTVQEQTRQDICEADARRLDDTLNKTLIAWLVDFNFGPQPKYPYIKTKTEPPEDLKRRSEIDVNITQMGFAIKPEYIEDTYGVPVERPVEAQNNPATLAELADTPQKRTMSKAQQAIDDAADAIPNELLQRELERTLAPVIAVIRESDSYEDAMTKLAETYPDMNTESLERLLTKAMFVAELWGIFNADKV